MSKSSNRRKTIAIALAVLGIAGLSLASASTLNLSSSATIQSGSVDIAADCQGSAKVPVTFGAPTFTAGVYASPSVNYSGLVTACQGLNYKAAVLVGTTWTELTASTVPSSGTITADLGAIDANSIIKVALSVYNN